MSIIECQEIGEGRRGSWEQQGRRSIFTADRTWKIVTDDPETSFVEILIAGSRLNFVDGLPLNGDPYYTDNESIPWIYCKGFTPEQDGDDPHIWRVGVSYSSEVERELASTQSTGSNSGSTGSAATGGDLQPDPLKMPVRVSYSTRQRRVLRERDFSKKPTAGWGAIVDRVLDPQGIYDGTGRAFVNSAGERFGAAAEDDEYNLVITIRRNVKTFDRVRAWTYSGCVNETAWAGYLERAARITTWQGDPTDEAGVFYYAETLEIEVQWPNWDWELLNEGTYGWSRDGEHTKDVVDADSGIAINGKVLLDERGGILPRTEVALAIAVGAQTVTPASMRNILLGDVLLIDVGEDVNGNDLEEEVTVTAVASTTFTATFTKAHAAGCIVTGKPTYKKFQRRSANFKKLKLTL